MRELKLKKKEKQECVVSNQVRANSVIIEIGTSATLELPDDNWNWKLGRTQYFREGVRDTNRPKRFPREGSWGILCRKTFKVEVLGNGISGIPRTIQCLKVSF